MASVQRVELLPWQHSIQSLMQEELVKHLHRLPRGSNTAIELTEKELVFFGEVMRMFKGHKLNQAVLGLVEPNEAGVLDSLESVIELSGKKQGDHLVTEIEQYRILSGEDWAVLEILNACEKRGHRVFPIDNKLVRDVRGGVHALAHLERANHAAEMFLEGGISRALKQVGSKTLHVMIGTGHIQPISNRLNQREKIARTNTVIFSHKKKVEEAIRLEMEWRIKARQGPAHEMEGWQIAQRQGELITATRKTPQDAIVRIYTEIKKRTPIAKKASKKRTRLRRKK